MGWHKPKKRLIRASPSAFDYVVAGVYVSIICNASFETLLSEAP